MGESLGTRLHEVGNGLPLEVMACCVQSVLVGMHRAGGCVVTCSCCIIMLWLCSIDIHRYLMAHTEYGT